MAEAADRTRPEFQPVRPKRRRGRRILFLLLVLLILGGGAGAAWHFYGDRMTAAIPGRDKEVPVVRADSKPYKVRPENPGGMPVPDRDKLVYERIQGGAGKAPDGKTPKVEHLLPPPETPVAREGKPAPAAPPPSAAATPPPPPSAPASAPSATPPQVIQPAPTPQPPRVAEAPAQGPTPGTTALPATPPAAESLALKKPEPAPAPAEPVPQVTTRRVEPQQQAARPSGAFQVQLGALRSQEQAENEWQKMRRANSDLLGELELSVARADLGEAKGIFYRVRAGPFADEAAARALCNKLADRKMGCLVVRPGQ